MHPSGPRGRILWEGAVMEKDEFDRELRLQNLQIEMMRRRSIFAHQPLWANIVLIVANMSLIAICGMYYLCD